MLRSTDPRPHVLRNLIGPEHQTWVTPRATAPSAT